MRLVLTNANVIDGVNPTPIGDALGTLDAGKLADLIAVAANSLDDIHNIRKLLLVIKDGRIVSDKRGSAKPPFNR